jgi:uncharacterized protein YqgC (DUF456 family)
MSTAQAIGLTVLPFIGAFAGSAVTKHNIKTWYRVS